MTRQGWCPGRREVLALCVGLGVAGAGRGAAQESAGGRRARPQPDDRFVFAGGPRRTELVTLTDLPADGPPVVTYPMDPATRIVRDDSRLNQVLLVRLDPSRLNSDTRARAADGIVGYSAVCTHTGCDAWDWQPAAGVVKCPCHFSEFDLKNAAQVLNGPAPRRLPALPVRIVDGVPVVAGVFIGRPGFEMGGG